jgi:phospholipid/cholesterol/gamma-HCH transport system ATP-binding protein
VPSDNLVEFSRVDFSYDRRPILQGVDMTFPRGKVIAIMGGSGSGKTTLLRLIGGQLRPDRGEVRVDSNPIYEMSHAQLYAMRRKMGMLFQFGALFTDLSAFENVAFPLREHTDLPGSMIRDLVLMKLNAVGLRGAQALKPAELSGGMARRVALARAIALDPMLIMYDEPFTGLDPISVGIIGNLIRRLNDALGATSIVVTHDVQETLDRGLRVLLVRRASRCRGDSPAGHSDHRTFRASIRSWRGGRTDAIPLRRARLWRGSAHRPLTC